MFLISLMIRGTDESLQSIVRSVNSEIQKNIRIHLFIGFKYQNLGLLKKFRFDHVQSIGTMSEVFNGYERQYCDLSASLSKKCSSAVSLDGGKTTFLLRHRFSVYWRS